MLKFSKIVVSLILFFLLTACASETVTLKLDDGSIYYEGEVNENNEPHGKGIYYIDNENIMQIEGEFVNGEPHGKGIWYLDKSQGLIYFKGQFVNGEPVYKEVELGMTQEEITNTTKLGRPENKQEETIDKEKVDVWYFENGEILVFKNDKLIEIR